MYVASRWSLRSSQQSIRTLTSKQGPRSAIRRIPPVQPRPTGRSKPEPQSQSESVSQSNSQPPPQDSHAWSKVEAVSNALGQVPDSENDLVTPVHIPEDPNSVLRETHPAMNILDNSAIVVQRQLEMMNVLMGFEQANKYVVMDPHGNHIGYLAEQEHGLGSTLARQMFRTHRSFTTHVFDRHEKEVLRFHRPFSWISSRIRVYNAIGQGADNAPSMNLRGTGTQSLVNQSSAGVSTSSLSDMRIIGIAEQQWHLFRRKYNLFLARESEAEPDTPQLTSGNLPLSNSKELQIAQGDQREPTLLQFAHVDEPLLSWDFSLRAEHGSLLGLVNRNFSGFAREIFTDTGVYALRMDAASLGEEPAHLISKTGQESQASLQGYPGMTLDQRAVMLATAVSIDFDYFSRHSSASGAGTMWPMWFPWFGGAGEAGAAGAEAGAIGGASEAGISEVSAAGRGLGAGEGAAAGMGSIAGYEAMQRARDGSQETDAQSPVSGDPYQSPQQQPGAGEEVWGRQQDPWGQGGDRNNNDPWGGMGGNGGGSNSGSSGSGGGDGGGFDVSDWF